MNITDGKYVYTRAPATEENQPLFNYTSMCTLMERRYPIKDMQSDDIELAEPFLFLKGCKMLKIPREE